MSLVSNNLSIETGTVSNNLFIGYVGQGTGYNYAPLQVNSFTNIGLTFTYFFYGSSELINGIGTLPISINAQGTIYSATSAVAASDERIKTNIQPLPTKESLDIIRNLKPSSFDYIDKILKTSKKQNGFIAQEVKSNLEEAVSFLKDSIPNIFDLGEIKDGNIITLRTKNTDLFQQNDSGNPIKIFLNDKNNKRIETYLEKIIDEKSFKITDFLNEEEIFVNGQEVENFLVLDKDVIFTHTTAALKELDSIVKNQEIIINNLKSRLEILENKH